MSCKSTRDFGSKSFQRFEDTFPGVVFIATAFLCVGGSIAMFLSNTPTAA